MRIALAQINTIIADITGNTQKILIAIERAKKENIDLLVFPETTLIGYPPEDFLLLPHFIDDVESALEVVIANSQDISLVVGTVRRHEKQSEKNLANCAAIIANGKLIGFQDKMLLPTYNVFNERRFFEPASETKLWDICGQKVGVTICEDIWKEEKLNYARDPVEELAKLKPDVTVNLSASPFSLKHGDERLVACQRAAATLGCPFLLCNQVGGNDSLIFDGNSFCVNEKGQLIGRGKGFEEDFIIVDLAKQKEVPLNEDLGSAESMYKALTLGLKDYFHKSGFKKACLGLSGGVDSALVACLAVESLGKDNVIGLLMPSRYSSEGSVLDSIHLAKNLEIQVETISIEKPFQTFLDLLEKPFSGLPINETEENLQARIRGILLMAFSNKLGYIVLSTGNKSELAMGYSTLYGDMCGGLAIISDLTKQQVYTLTEWINRKEEIIPWTTIKKPPSAELRANQKDSDSLPDYEIVDCVLEAYIVEHQSAAQIADSHGYPLSLVQDLIKRIHRNEYKRRQAPLGLRISEKSFSIGRNFPIVQRYV